MAFLQEEDTTAAGGRYRTYICLYQLWQIICQLRSGGIYQLRLVGAVYIRRGAGYISLVSMYRIYKLRLAGVGYIR
jgi:hypothetical protein